MTKQEMWTRAQSFRREADFYNSQIDHYICVLWSQTTTKQEKEKARIEQKRMMDRREYATKKFHKALDEALETI